MSKKVASQTDQERVTEYIGKMPPAPAKMIETLRKIILSVDPEIAEQIKWNSPAFHYTGEMKPFDPKEYKRDIVVLNLYRKAYILLVFPTGARIQDDTGLLEGNYTDGRRMMKIMDMEDLAAKENGLKMILRKWLESVEK